MPYRDKDKQRRYQRERRARLRAEWIEQNGPCAECGSADQLEVDHVDPDTKVSHNIWSWSVARRSAELAKCQVLCSRCHKAKTAASKARPVPHGTDTAYTRNGCRCQKCRDAHNQAKNAWRARRREAGLPYT